jgi:hypothetical protein
VLEGVTAVVAAGNAKAIIIGRQLPIRHRVLTDRAVNR